MADVKECDKSSKDKVNSGKEPPPKSKSSKGFVDKDLPRQFGRLTLLRHVARGGMGEVYLACTGGIEGAERPCIVKIIRREHADDKSFLARFFDEARIQAQFQHPGVVQVVEASTDETEKPYVVLEYVEGRNLSEVRHRTLQLKVRVEWADAVALGISLGEGLAHIHERTDANGKPLEICHRDLSPQNVMISYGGDVKVIDFGTARGENRRCRTVSGIVYAKPGYVAPEVANENPGGAPADLYAFGIMIWELVAGRRFLSGDASSHMAAVGRGQRSPTPLAQLVGAPGELDRIISKLTATEIGDRYPTARDAVGDLAKLLARAPSLANGERGVRARISHFLQRLYPSEPTRSRAEFARLVAKARKVEPKPSLPVESPPPPPESDSDLLSGTRYRVVRELGRGDMGVVYEAFHVDLNRTVALKVLPSDRASSEEALSRFRTEARAIGQLRHPGIVQLHDYGVSGDGQPFYAMEMLEGETLEGFVEREKGMDWREAVELCVQACKALETAHDAGIVHRDIKPANLFLTNSGVLKMLDFGVAKTLESADGGESQGISLVGTPEYMAPEQISGGEVDARSDLYSLAAVLYELVTGRMPHTAASTVALLDDKLHKEPERPTVRAPQRGLPAALDDAIVKSLHREPAFRYQNAEELRTALERALEEPDQRRSRRRTVARVAVALLGLGILGAGIASPAAQDVRERAFTAAKPMVASVDGLRTMVVRAPEVPELSVGGGAALASCLENAGRSIEESGPTFELQPAPVEEEVAVAAEGSDDPNVDEPTDADATEGETKTEAEVAKTDDGKATGDEKPSDEEPTEKIDRVQLALDAAEEQMQKNSITGYAQFKKIALRYPKDARAQRAWSEAAEATKAWGAAYRAARQWAKVDTNSIDAQVQFARMQRAIGQGKLARQTLRKLAEKNPDAEAVQRLLEHFGGRRVASNR